MKVDPLCAKCKHPGADHEDVKNRVPGGQPQFCNVQTGGGGYDEPPEYCSCDEYVAAVETKPANHALADRVTQILTARAAIIESGTAAGAIPCPACGGELRFTVTQHRKRAHVWAGCQTQGCLRWLE